MAQTLEGTFNDVGDSDKPKGILFEGIFNDT